MRKFIFLLMFGCLTSCGVREARESSNSLVGVWDSTICEDRIALNEDLTFAWVDDSTHKGSYWVTKNQINFKFSDKIPETYQFTVTEKELTLLKGNQQFEYVKIPPVFDVNSGKYTIPAHKKSSTSNLTMCK